MTEKCSAKIRADTHNLGVGVKCEIHQTGVCALAELQKLSNFDSNVYVESGECFVSGKKARWPGLPKSTYEEN